MEPELDKDNPEKSPDPNKISESSLESNSSGKGEIHKRKRQKIKIRKRIRIKKKPSAKKKVKKIAERVFWALIIIGFVASLIVMIVQLDIKDERYKQKQKTTRSKSGY